MIRSLQFTDIAALLLFLGRSPVNEARVLDRLGSNERGLPSVVPVFRDCLVSGDKQQSLVYVHRGLIRGVVCLQRCHGPSAWVIERLLLVPRQEKFCLDLLGSLGSIGYEFGAQRIFLRLDFSNLLVDIAKQAGFNQYLTELIYQLGQTRRGVSPQQPLSLRPKSGADELGLFRLYSTVVPLQVRITKGMTFEEWHQSRDRDSAREFVLERAGEISARLRIGEARSGGRFDIMGELEVAELALLVDHSLGMISDRGSIYCVVPEYQQKLRRILEERGFSQVGRYACLSRQLAVRVPELQSVPLRA